MKLMELTIKDYHHALKSGAVKTKELVEFYLERIRQYDAKLNSIICVNPNAIKEAEALDLYYKEHGFKGGLHGVPVLLKDNVNTSDMATTAGSISLKGFVPDEDAFIVRQMKKAGALIIAKTNLHEFAIWGETISSIQGQSVNPYDLTRTPGGSSGGTGASVAANFGLIGIGTDTINSIRSPSSANSLVGIRPTVGLVSKAGVVPYSKTQDSIGPITRTVEDAVIFLDAIKGYDPEDPKTMGAKTHMSDLTEHLRLTGIKNKRIGILKGFFGSEPIHHDTNTAINELVAMIKDQCEMIEVTDQIDSDDLVKNVSVHLYDLKDHLNAYLSALPERAPVHSVQEIMDGALHHPGIKENLMKASQLSTTTEAYQLRMERREETKTYLLSLMKKYEVDALIYPHQKQLVCKIGGSQKERNGVLGSVTGFPSICIPAGFSQPTEDAPIGVPIGMEILGRPFDEGTLIEIAYAIEQLTHIRKEPESVLQKGV
jgi:Asp-tRNA(Asn)/Glu-tRNA(Gln) amidotransferase A subunit family amidase